MLAGDYAAFLSIAGGANGDRHVILLDWQAVDAAFGQTGCNMAIERIGVFPDHRRKRVGTKLIAHAMLEARVRKCEFMSTVLRESNVPAQKFYFECGFRAGRIAGPLVGWFGTEAAVVMRRPVVLPIQGGSRDTDPHEPRQ